jgi:hypothetical protein
VLQKCQVGLGISVVLQRLRGMPQVSYMAHSGHYVFKDGR